MAPPISISTLRTGLSNSYDVPSAQKTSSFERIPPRPRVLTLSRRPRRAKYPRQKAQSKPSSQQPSTNTMGYHLTRRNKARSLSAVVGSTTQNVSEKKALGPDEIISELDTSEGHINDSSSIGEAARLSEPLTTSGLQRRNEIEIGDDYVMQEKETSVFAPLTKRSPNPEKIHHRVRVTEARDYLSGDLGETIPDITHGTTISSQQPGVDSLLVEAIARSVAQQLHMLSTRTSQSSDSQTNQGFEVTDSRSPFRTSSQQEALARFTQELQRCAEHSGAKDKPRIFTSTPTWSEATIRTISALLPFRSEFTAAGLAVTSKDQINTHPPHVKVGAIRRARIPFPRRVIKHARLGQLDGNDGSLLSGAAISSNMSNVASEWRKNTTDEIVHGREQKLSVDNIVKAQCLPCAPTQIHRSETWGCLQLMQKSQPRLLTSKPTTRSQKIGADITPTTANVLKKTSPEWANLTPPHIIYPDHKRHSTGTKCKQVINQVKQEPLRRDPSFPTFFSGPRRPVSLSDLHQKTMGLPGQAPRRQSPHSDLLIGNHSPLRYRNRLKRPSAGLGKSIRLAQSFMDLRQQRSMRISPKRHRSVPTRKTPNDLRSTAMSTKSLSDLLSTPDNKIRSLPSTEWVTGSPIKSSLGGKDSGKQIKSLRRNYSHGFEQPGFPRHVEILSRGYLNPYLTRPNIPQRISSIQGNAPSPNNRLDEGEIMDRDVLRGLHIATSAACDEKTNAIIHAKTGLHIRRFLAGLVLETLGASPNEQGRDNRAEMRRIKK